MPYRDKEKDREYKRLWRLKPENLAKERTPEHLAKKAEYTRERNRRLREADPELHQKKLALRRAFRAARSEQERERERQYRLEYEREYYADPTNKERHRNGERLRKVRRNLLLPEGFCPYCGDPVSVLAKKGEPGHAQVDHIIPTSRGGSDEPENKRLVCERHNWAKKDLTHEEYVADILKCAAYILRKRRRYIKEGGFKCL